MPQELQVLRCFSCEAFQVHIVKKIQKWECKICGEKQSTKKVYAKGSGKDCRLYVQQLNQRRFETSIEDVHQDVENFSPVNIKTNVSQYESTSSINNKCGSPWTIFMNTDILKKEANITQPDVNSVEDSLYEFKNIEENSYDEILYKNPVKKFKLMHQTKNDAENKNKLINKNKPHLKFMSVTNFNHSDRAQHQYCESEKLTTNLESTNVTLSQDSRENTNQLNLNTASVNHMKSHVNINLSTSFKDIKASRWTEFMGMNSDANENKGINEGLFKHNPSNNISNVNSGCREVEEIEPVIFCLKTDCTKRTTVFEQKAQNVKIAESDIYAKHNKSKDNLIFDGSKSLKNEVNIFSSNEENNLDGLFTF